MIKVFEAFAGYGSTCFALKELKIEHELVGFSEIDKYAIQCFQQNHGGKNYGDITKIDWKEVPDFDLLTGGFPCQAFSTAGKQQGEADARGQLGLELTKALIAKQPKYFLFENVKGFMSKRFTATREKFVKSWEAAGYVVDYKILNTKDFGVPQNRERVWFVGRRKDVAKSRVVMGWYSIFNFPESFELKLKLKDILEPQVDEKYFLKQEQVNRLLNPSVFLKKHNPLQVKDFSDCIRQRDFKEPKCIELKELTSNVSQAMRVFDSEGVGCTLSGLGGGMGAKTGLYAMSLYPRNGNPKQGGTGTLVKNGETSYCLDQGNAQAIINKTVVRRLTPKECFRLQGFLNDQINLEGLSDTQKYKLAGNGQSINVVKLILKELLEPKQ